MSSEPSSRFPVATAGLFLLVVSILIAPMGALVVDALADGALPASSITMDPLSDTVGATAAEFRVDESGSATYSIPLYGVPGTAGVAPKISLSYSSQAGYGPLGKGWSIGGLSSISRCRATREAGDFINATTVDGNPAPINFTSTDRYCLDGQRLLPAPGGSPACASAGGMSAVGLRTEIESFQRVCAYTPTATPTNGPAFFTVERKDGSTSWYGDRNSNAASNRPDGYFELDAAAALLWAQTRFQDSTGNYIDYFYAENPGGAGTHEHLINEIRYTGKTVLPGQAGNAQAPYAKLVFTYSLRPAAQRAKGYSFGGTLDQTHRLESITSCATLACASTDQARFYQLGYVTSVSGNGQDTMASLQECRDSTKASCMAPTTFAWSTGKHEFATDEAPSSLALANDHIRGFKMGDINGDGRQDMAFQYLAGSGCVGGTWIVSTLSTLNASASPTLAGAQFNCVPTNIVDRGEGAWHLLDYNGDGRDDLFVSSATGQGWKLYPSNGSGFDNTQNLISTLSPAIPSSDGVNSQVQLADLNGDGLTDIVYPSDGLMRVRLMERQGGSFGWGVPRTIAVDLASLGGMSPTCSEANNTCTRSIASTPTPKTGFMQMADFNGDAASDLLINVTDTIRYDPWLCDPLDPLSMAARSAEPSESAMSAGAEASWAILPYTEEAVVPDASPMAPPGNCVKSLSYTSIYAFTVQELTPTEVGLTAYASIANSNSTDEIRLIDANGDGLTDVATRQPYNNHWYYRVNHGRGMNWSVDLGDYGELGKKIQFVDVNGDGRTDMLPLATVGGNRVYQAQLALPGGGFAAATPLPGGRAVYCSGSCDVNQYTSLFSDFDGDGNLDFLSIKYGSTLGLYFHRASNLFTPRDIITRITNGLGAQTDITYAPLTNKDLYRRDVGSRNNLNWGRGSPVMDLLAPSYAVAQASSSSPQAGAPTAKATVHYRYAGARVQSGGRGFLGFAVIDTIDPNQTGGHVVTTTAYAQNFPFVGMPVQTVKKAVANLAYLVPACLNGTAITNACFATPGQPHASLGGSWFSDGGQVWESAPAVLTAQLPLHVRTFGTEEKLRDPFTGTQTSEVVTSFGYGGYGNVTSTSVSTYTGASTLVSTISTANTYTDDAAKWRLGRLTGSTVTHSRPGKTNVVRTSNFAYSTSGVYTGLLTVERSQYGGPVDQDLRKEYTYDDYGNKTIGETCANPATSCSTAINFHPASVTAIQRYSKVVYDTIGRYPIATVEPFWNGTGVVEKTVSMVFYRNIFGDVTEAEDFNGVSTRAFPGSLGRGYYTKVETDPLSNSGVESYTTYRFCGTGTNLVNCPVGAKFRQRIVSSGAPRQWTYFDVLGRPIMKAAESFNVGVINKDVSAVCTDYDATGKPKRSSNPFFLAGTGGADGPTGLEAVCTAGARLWTTTTYDLLGRPTRVESPDPNGVAAATIAYNNLTTGSRDPRNNLTNSVRNGKGELIQVVDATGLALNYSYAADGSLLSVTRDAGRGAITNSFGYDMLGRKTSQNDPDSGASQFQYNALGELIVQIDAKGQRIENEYDARGRVWRKTVKTAAGVVETQSTFTFDTAANGVGQLASETIVGTYAGWSGQPTLALGYTRSATYDVFGRGSAATTTIDGVAYPGSVAYDALGRPWKGQDASGRWVKTEYDARGAAAAVCNSSAADTVPTCPADANTYLRTLATDEWGHVTRERRGNSAAMEVNRTYYNQNGRVAEICGGTSAGCNLIKEGYAWDLAGNLSTHTKENRYAETFLYDSLNRLQQAKVVVQDGVTANLVTQKYEYDQLGNICRRDTYGWASRNYSYAGRSGCGLGGANSTQGSGGTGILGPHQISALVDATTMNQYYDANGNMIQRDGPAAGNDWLVKYNAANQAYEITTDTGARQRFWYGPGGARYKSEDGGKKTLYLGSVEIVTNGGAVTTKRTIAGVMLQTVIGSAATNYYLFHDQLGSLVRIANAAGVVVNSMDFLAFGARRNVDTQAANGTAPTLTTRGFTGHEMLDSVNLIHMNGRIYDQYAGRFLQPDPVIQAPGNAQSWNAYAYVFNNPLVYTDPTGNFSLRQFLGIVIIVVAAITQQYWAINAAAKFWGTVAFGGLAGGVSTGTWQGALWGAFSAAAFYGVGEAFSGVTGEAGTGVFGSGLSGGAYGAKVLAHGMTGGVMSTLQGGKFGHGFASAGVTQAFAPGIERIGGGAGNYAGARIAAAAVLGGTTSKLSGGKFANGAITAAFSRAFNDEFNHRSPEVQEDILKGEKEFIPVSSTYDLERGGSTIGWERDYMLTEGSRVDIVPVTGWETEIDFSSLVPPLSKRLTPIGATLSVILPTWQTRVLHYYQSFQYRAFYRQVHVMSPPPGRGSVVTTPSGNSELSNAMIWRRSQILLESELDHRVCNPCD